MTDAFPIPDAQHAPNGLINTPKVLVPATPTPPPQNAADVAPTSGSNVDVAPTAMTMSQTPLTAATAAVAGANAPVNNGPATPDVVENSVEEPSLDLSLSSMFAPPLTQPSCRLTRDIQATLCASRMENGEGRAADTAFFIPGPEPVPSRWAHPEASAAVQHQNPRQDEEDTLPLVWGSARAAATARSPSPLSFDWSATNSNASLSPTVRAVTAAAARASAGATTNTTGATGIGGIGDTDGTTRGAHQLNAQGNNHATGLLGRLSQRADGEANHGNANAARAQTAESTDYFAYFPTPPHFVAPPFEDTAIAERNSLHRAIPPTAVTQHATSIRPGTNNGEPTRNSLLPDDVGNSRKRVWPGSPNLEEIRRGLSRPRTNANGRPSWDETPLPGDAHASVSNPWRSGSRRRTPGTRRGLDRVPEFTPVAVSTPRAASVDIPDPAVTENSVVTASTGPTTAWIPNAINVQSRPAISARAAQAIPGTRPQANQPRAGPPTMDIDEEAEDRDAASISRKPTNKGKGRATEQDATESEDHAEAYIGPCEQLEGWRDADLQEARQRSLRQMLEDRARRQGFGGGRLYATNEHEAGPSRSYDAGPSYAAQQNAFPREAHASRHAIQDDMQGRHRVCETHNREGRTARLDNHVLRNQNYPGESNSRDDYEAPTGQDERRELPRPRLMSAFVPLPNTRAAEYLNVQETAGGQRSTNPRLYHGAAEPASQRRAMALADFDDERMRSPTERGLPRTPGGRREEDDAEEEERGNSLDPDEREEDGELLPSVLRGQDTEDDEVPTAPPEGGFPTVHRDDPETLIRGMADEWVREMWRDPPSTSVAVDVFNYRFSEDDAHNRQVADALQWALQQITGETDFDVVPPEQDTDRRLRARDLPTVWMIRGLSTRGTARALAQRTWSFKRISFFTALRSASIPSWLFTLEGYLRGDERKIRAAVLRALGDRERASWITELVASNPDFDGVPLEEAVEIIHASVRVEVMQLGNGNYIANVFVRPPTRDPRLWRQWVAELRSRRYPSFAIGTGRVRYIAQCIGCHGVSHPVHLCPYARIRGWNGPRPGEGVFGERGARGTPSTRSRPHGRGSPRGAGQRSNTSGEDRGGRTSRRDERDPRTPRSRRGNGDSHGSARRRGPHERGDQDRFRKRGGRRN